MQAVEQQDFDKLDQLYFSWEDSLRSSLPSGEVNQGYGLLSGYSFDHFSVLPLREVERAVRQGTVYTPFLSRRLLPRLVATRPSIVGITIASQAQLVPAIELLQLIRSALPEAFITLGGNIVTRLRDTPALQVLSQLADSTILFQGDRVFLQILRAVEEVGARRARTLLPRIVTDELVPFQSWAVPVFDGTCFDEIVGTPTVPYVSTRGCYWGKCHFCAIPAGWSKTGYGGSAPADFVANQLVQMALETGIPRVKLVDEAFPPAKVLPLAERLRRSDPQVEWECYARLEPAWEDPSLVEHARAGGLRKLYFGLEQAPSTNRSLLGKNDHGDPLRILRACNDAGIKTHLFCMVGYPGTSREDAKKTVGFLLENESLIDTADLVGFRLDRGTNVPGVRAASGFTSDWAIALPFEPTQPGVLTPEEVSEIEAFSQEQLWEAAPRLLHPLYRLVGHWNRACESKASALPREVELPCLLSS